MNVITTGKSRAQDPKRREIKIPGKKKSWRVNAKVVKKYIDRRQARLLKERHPLEWSSRQPTDFTLRITPLSVRQPGP